MWFQSYSVEIILDIPLIINNNDNIDLLDFLKEYFYQENAIWENKCVQCNKKYQPHFKTIKFNRIKDIIIFSIQRFDKNSGMKNNAK